MITKDSNISVRDSLKSSIKFRELVTSIREVECGLGPQSQTPDSSDVLLTVRLLRCDYISKTELLYLCLLTYYLNNCNLRYQCPHLLVELLSELPQKVEKASYLTNQERIELWKLFSRIPLYFYSETNLVVFTRRKIMGIISDPQVIRKVRKRLYQKIRPTRSRVRRTERHRGYRDHGTLRPAHRWLPKTDYSLTELQNQIEDERNRLKRYYQLALTGKNPVAIEEFPTIFDKPKVTKEN